MILLHVADLTRGFLHNPVHPKHNRILRGNENLARTHAFKAHRDGTVPVLEVRNLEHNFAVLLVPSEEDETVRHEGTNGITILTFSNTQIVRPKAVSDDLIVETFLPVLQAIVQDAQEA